MTTNDRPRLPLTERTMERLRRGDRAGARAAHRATVRDAFDRAKGGAVINLSDLVASAEQLHLDEAEEQRQERKERE